MSTMHPLSPLSAAEIKLAVALVKASWPATTDFHFKVVTLQEPPKKELVPFLAAERQGKALPQPERKAFVAYYLKNTNRFHEALANITTGTIESNILLGPNLHGNVDMDEAVMVEKIALSDEKVLAEVAKLSLPDGAVICADTWIYGSDGVTDNERLYQVYMYMRDPNNAGELDSNHYAFPLPISPVVDCVDFKVIRIDILPTGKDATVGPLKPYVPGLPSEYVPEGRALRKDVRPLLVAQPEGASFTVTPSGETGHTLDWQKWNFRIGFNQREGIVLYDVHYDGRPLFHRVSLSDMNIPYADPRAPFSRKTAFDLGDAGAGATANNLKLGCDCLGHIQYLDAVVSDGQGEPVHMENVVCIHEQDAGIGWKHTNFRTGRGVVVRGRELVLQSIITLMNYEYILMFVFNQAAELTYEVRATGIVSTQPIDHSLDKVGVPFGTVVHPGVLATHHQHIFSLRVDPMIDGHTNQLVYSEAAPMAYDGVENPQAVGYVVTETPVLSTRGLDADYDRNRIFKVVNHHSRNPVNNKPVGYKIMAPPLQKMLANAASFHHKRAEFADHDIYVTTHHDRELFSGGWYTNQSRGGHGVRAWAARGESLDPGSDIVVWIQFGINHVPRTEDFPVMPVESIKVHLKPVNFFSINPALDVPGDTQAVNKSTLVCSSSSC